MVVFTPDTLQAHTFELIPRITPTGSGLNIEYFNEATGLSDAVTDNAYTYENGVLTIIAFKSVTEGQRFSYKVTNQSNEIIARGLIICTAQAPQDYEIDNSNWQYSAQ